MDRSGSRYGQNQLYYGCAHRPILQSGRMGWQVGGSRKTMELICLAAKSRICVCFKSEVEDGGVCPPPPSRLQWLASSPPTSLVAHRSAIGVATRLTCLWVGACVCRHLGTGVVAGMGKTNFTMVVPTVQSSRAPLEGAGGWGTFCG